MQECENLRRYGHNVEIGLLNALLHKFYSLAKHYRTQLSPCTDGNYSVSMVDSQIYRAISTAWPEVIICWRSVTVDVDVSAPSTASQFRSSAYFLIIVCSQTDTDRIVFEFPQRRECRPTASHFCRAFTFHQTYSTNLLPKTIYSLQSSSSIKSHRPESRSSAEHATLKRHPQR